MSRIPAGGRAHSRHAARSCFCSSGPSHPGTCTAPGAISARGRGINADTPLPSSTPGRGRGLARRATVRPRRRPALALCRRLPSYHPAVAGRTSTTPAREKPTRPSGSVAECQNAVQRSPAGGSPGPLPAGQAAFPCLADRDEGEDAQDGPSPGTADHRLATRAPEYRRWGTSYAGGAGVACVPGPHLPPSRNTVRPMADGRWPMAGAGAALCFRREATTTPVQACRPHRSHPAGAFTSVRWAA